MQQALLYAGDVTPHQAHAMLQAGTAVIVDVRTAEERHFVGSVPGTLSIPWAYGLNMQRNEAFLAELQAVVPEKDATLLFLCRSGARSQQAATLAAQQGYSHAYNIVEGFEGEKNNQGQRRQINGWIAAGLPWLQS